MTLLIRDKVPFMLALLLAILSYTLKSTYDEVMEMPVITYEFSRTNDSLFTCEFTNVSADKVYRNLNFKIVDFEKSNKIIKARLKSCPRIQGDNDENLVEANTNPNTIEFSLTYFPPKSKYMLDIIFSGSTLLPEIEIIPSKAMESIILKRPSLMTIVATYNFEIKMCLLIITALLIVIYIYYLIKKNII